MPAETPLDWIGSSKKDLLAFPEPVIHAVGYALGVAQLGGKHPHAKPWKGEGGGVFEVILGILGTLYLFRKTIFLHAINLPTSAPLHGMPRDRQLVVFEIVDPAAPAARSMLCSRHGFGVNFV